MITADNLEVNAGLMNRPESVRPLFFVFQSRFATGRIPCQIKHPAIPHHPQIRSHSYWFARHSKSINFLVLTLAVVGIYEALSLPIAVFPATNFPRIIIGVDNGVMPIDQMEVTITRPIENAVNSVPGLEDVRSTTSRGSAEVDLSFNWNVDMVQTLQQVNSALARIQSTLPSTAVIDTHRLDFASFPDPRLQPDLRKSPANAIVGDGHLRNQAASEPAEWRRHRHHPGRAAAGISDYARSRPRCCAPTSRCRTFWTRPITRTLIDSPGLLSRNHQLFLGLLDSQVHSADQIGDMVIKNVNDTPGSNPGRWHRDAFVGAGLYGGHGEWETGGIAQHQPAAGQQHGGSRQRSEPAKSNAIRPTLPAGVELNVFYDQSNIVRESIGSVRDAIIIGLFLSGMIIWLFLRDWGTALMTGLVVPVTILVTFIVMKIMGQSFNMMTLGGLAAAGGLVIDDAIVVVENIVLHRDGGEGPLEAVSSAIKELTVPLIGSTLTPIVVFLPLISITGVTGVFFRALAIAMSVSLLTSLALALGWTTNLGTFLINAEGRRPEPPVQTRHMRLPNESAELSEEEQLKRMMAAEEASLEGGWFGKHHRILRALVAPRAGASCLAWRLLRDSDRGFLCLL